MSGKSLLFTQSKWLREILVIVSLEIRYIAVRCIFDNVDSFSGVQSFFFFPIDSYFN